MRLSQQELDAARAEVDQAASLTEALWRIAAASAPAGDIAVAQQAAQILMRTAPLASLIPQGRINPVGPVPVSPADSDPLASNQARFQVLYLNSRGLAIAAQLDRVRERFDPDEGDLLAVFACDAIGSASKTGMLVHAFQHFWAGQDDAAVHLTLPRVEDLLREIERGLNVPVVSVAQGKTPGGLSQLGSLIAAMPIAGFDPNWTRSFDLLLTDGEHGLNLRNEVGHGLCDRPPRHHVALALHAALFLLAVAHGVIALPPRESEAGTGTDLRTGRSKHAARLADDHLAVPALLRRRCHPGTDQEPGGRDRHRADHRSLQEQHAAVAECAAAMANLHGGLILIVPFGAEL